MQARQQAGVTQAEVSLAAGQAAAAWAQVEAMESKGDAAGAAASAAEAVALQQQAQQCQAAADAAAVQAHRQVRVASRHHTSVWFWASYQDRFSKSVPPLRHTSHWDTQRACQLSSTQSVNPVALLVYHFVRASPSKPTCDSCRLLSPAMRA